ncbi:MAG: hypothetical protein LKK41_03300 [Olsenella sp.]|jgi:hypothetical protein|nr:hypothetical protein [Olsenella sp.]
MKKSYVYESPFYNIEVTFTGVFCAVVCIACIAIAGLDVFIPRGLALIFGAVAFYQVWNTFVSLSNPERVEIDEEGDSISFSGFGRVDSYKLSELSTFLVRPFPSSGKTYLRVQNHNIFKGRYWVPTKMFSGGGELFAYLVNLGNKVHPNSLQARAYDINKDYLNHADQIEAVRSKERSARRNNRTKTRNKLRSRQKNAKQSADAHK